ncbi:hypothetical protein FGO68_gene9733 [Halteria grandinella]|uniref:Uncharacterized protein n=1 Tax=Halteria grandinella TaxID=5974 RepID=A0A8J8P5R7_HALGN|nr:hypothetical protein FGO68_gene9733 [Halteria grandinella]
MPYDLFIPLDLGEDCSMTYSIYGNEPSWVTFQDTHTLQIYPQYSVEQGVYPVTIKLFDQAMESTFNFNVIVSNVPPVFSSVLNLENQVVFIGDIAYYEIPTNQTDLELNSVDLYLKNDYLPDFMIFDTISKFILVPNTLDEGLKVVTVVLWDGAMLTEYPFSVLVIKPKIDPATGKLIKTLENTGPPAFIEPIPNSLQILEGESFDIALPSIVDPDGDYYKIKEVRPCGTLEFCEFDDYKFTFSPLHVHGGKNFTLQFSLIDITIGPKTQVYSIEISVLLITPDPPKELTADQVEQEKQNNISSLLKEGLSLVKVKLQIVQIQQNGAMKVTFNPQCKDLSLPSMLNNSTMRIDIQQRQDGDNFALDNLKQESIPFIVNDYNRKFLFIQIKFEDVSRISAGMEQDIIQLSVNATQYITDSGESKLYIIEDGVYTKKPAPAQISPKLYSLYRGISILSGTQLGDFVFLGSQAATQILFLLLNILWSLLQDMSFLMTLSLVSINVPGIAQQIQHLCGLIQCYSHNLKRGMKLNRLMSILTRAGIILS